LSKSRPDDSGSTSSLAPADQRPRGCLGAGLLEKPGSRTSHCAVPFPKRRPPEKRACRIIWHVKMGLQARKAKNDEKNAEKRRNDMPNTRTKYFFNENSGQNLPTAVEFMTKWRIVCLNAFL
jgi:hypothetical protein